MDKELREELDQARSKLEVLMSLLKSPSWDLVVELYKGQTQARLNEVGNSPTRSLEDAFDRNYKLGMAHGIALAARLPNDVYEELYRIYTAKLEEIRDAAAPSQ